ncbi:MAG: amidohydrolase family protein [Myxococcota bacterium]
MKRFLAISSDGHAGLQPQHYRPYVDAKYRDTFDVALDIQIKQTQEAEKMFLIADINEKWREGNEYELTGAWDHEARLKVCDDDGVAAEVLFPDGITEMNSPPFGAGLGLPTKGVDPELQWAGARAHNRWIAEFCQMAPERRCGVAVVPLMWDIEEAVKEAKWAREQDMRSVMIPVMWNDHAPYNDPVYDPFWAVCEDLGLVINYHSGPAPKEEYFGVWPPKPGDDLRRGGMGCYLSEVLWFVARPLTFLIWGGVFEKFPKLKVSTTEGMADWVPHQLGIWDWHFEHSAGEQKLGDYVSHLSMKPSEYFRRNVRVGSMVTRKEALDRERIGIKSFMWGTDYPHPEGTWPTTEVKVDTAFEGLPEDDIANILGINAAEWYGFDADKLAPIVDRIGPTMDRFEGPPA